MKTRVLTISKSYMTSTDRDKIRVLTQDSRIEAGLIIPSQWQDFSLEPPTDSSKEPFFCKQLPLYFNGHERYFMYKNLAATIASFKPNIINIEDDYLSFAAVAACRIARKIKAKIILNSSRNLDVPPQKTFQLIQNYQFNNTDAFIAHNQDASNVLKSQGFRGKIEIIPQLGLNESIFQAQLCSREEKSFAKNKLSLQQDRKWILFTGHLSNEQGVDDLIEACQLLSLEGVYTGLIVIGSGPQFEQLKHLARRSNREIIVKFLSPLPPHEEYDWFHAADIFCLPSFSHAQYKEPFNNAIIKAMATNTVIVGSTSGETPRTLSNAGLIFKEKNTWDLTEKLKMVITDASLTDKLIRAALERVKNNFTNKVLAQKIVAHALDLI